MRICLVASWRHPIRQPFSGGLESLTHALAHGLAARGHEVTLFAGPGSDPDLPVEVLSPEVFVPSAAAMTDPNAPSTAWMAEHHAYLGLMLGLARERAGRFDLVHNNSLHHLPVAMAPAVPFPVVTTLHTPALPWLESAMSLAPGSSRFTAVSEHTSRAWAHAVPSTVVRNGVDLDAWRWGPGGGPAVWSGRLVPEKAPHEAIEACRLAGVDLVLAGPAADPEYFDRCVRPRLGAGATYLGHLTSEQLGGVLATASVAVVTPAWDEPYGLVAAEAMACGTPVAAYDRGALGEVVGPAGALAEPGDPRALAEAMRRCRTLDRRQVRRHAERTCSLGSMLDQYERVYDLAVGGGLAA